MKVPTYILLLISLSWNLIVMAQPSSADSSQVNTQDEAVYNKSSQQVAATMASDSIIAPNVFTPNDDLINDDFEVTSSGNHFLSLKVFTRTGVMIYKDQAQTIKWDGHLDSGEKVLPGIYYYVIETVDVTPPLKKNGFVYIFK